MNGTPHPHVVQIREGDEHSSFRYYKVIYGDTSAPCAKRLPWREHRLKKAVEKAIRRHDKGSQQADQRRNLIRSIEHDYNQVLIKEPAKYSYESPTMVEGWGSELMKAALTHREYR